MKVNLIPSRLLQIDAPESAEAGPESGKRRPRILLLHTAETLDRGNRAFVRAFEEHLPRECRPVQLVQAEGLDRFAFVHCCQVTDRRRNERLAARRLVLGQLPVFGQQS